MSKVLDPNEILILAERAGLPGLDVYAAAMEDIATRLASAVAHHLKVRCTAATWEGENMAGLTASFAPHKAGDGMPAGFVGLDVDGDWHPLSRYSPRAMLHTCKHCGLETDMPWNWPHPDVCPDCEGMAEAFGWNDVPHSSQL